MGYRLPLLQDYKCATSTPVPEMGVVTPKYDGISNPAEYLYRFNVEIGVNQVEGNVRCKLLVAALSGNAYQWFKKLFPKSI